MELTSVQGRWTESTMLCICRSRSNRTRQGTRDWFKLGKEYIKALHCHPAYLTYTQSTSFEMPGWMKHKLESRLPGGMSITSDMAESKEELKSLLMSKKAGLKHHSEI